MCPKDAVFLRDSIESVVSIECLFVPNRHNKKRLLSHDTNVSWDKSLLLLRYHPNCCIAATLLCTFIHTLLITDRATVSSYSLYPYILIKKIYSFRLPSQVHSATSFAALLTPPESSLEARSRSYSLLFCGFAFSEISIFSR